MIEEKPGLTAYSLSKLFGFPLSSTQNLLTELFDELEIKYKEVKEDGRLKKRVYLRTIDDFTHDNFNYETIDHPWTKRLMKGARAQKMEVTFIMPDGSEQILMPDESIEDFKQRVS